MNAFTVVDAERITGRWVRMTRPKWGRGEEGQHWTYLALVQRAWATGTLRPGYPEVDGSLGMMMFEPNRSVPYTAFHLPADGTYEVLPGCADVAIRKPYAPAELLRETVCPSGAACTCIAMWR